MLRNLGVRSALLLTDDPGDGPFEVILRTDDPRAPAPAPRSGDPIDTHLLHGARFRLGLPR